MADNERLKQLGASQDKTTYHYAEPDFTVLDTFIAPEAGMEVIAEASEFTSLCPITGQPDYGTIKLHYVVHECALESKSFKVYLNRFRQHGAFCETIAKEVKNDLVAVLDPLYLEVDCAFAPRGGISFRAISRYSLPDE